MANKRHLGIKRKGVKGGSPPEGGGWTWLTGRLLTSAAWRQRSINCARLIDYLLIRHIGSAGMDNGLLPATYDELVKFGITRRLIGSAIQEAEEKGLIVVERRGRKSRTENYYSTYRLTFFATLDKTAGGEEIWRASTDEWERWLRKKKKSAPKPESDVTNGNLSTPTRGTAKKAKTAETSHSAVPDVVA